MKRFVLIYDRGSQVVESLAEYDSQTLALQARWDAEDLYRHRPDVEIVLFLVDSEAALRRTHARYFTTLTDLVASGMHSAA
jgi:hypothetical protein